MTVLVVERAIVEGKAIDLQTDKAAHQHEVTHPGQIDHHHELAHHPDL